MPAEMRRVLSSHVMEIGYDPESQELWVRFAPSIKTPRGLLGAYLGVDPDTAEDVMSAPSIGAALNDQIKGSYSWRPAG